ncbi:TPA_asm: UL37.3 [Human alphaherpesvirus 1]|nr:TPA_asm: UL37.3 [Human alphaherpesvirus 1]
MASSSWRIRGSARSARSCSTPRAARAYMLINRRLVPTSGGGGGCSWTRGRSCSTAPLEITYSSRSSCSMLSAICIVGPRPPRAAGSRRVISAPSLVRWPSTVGR